MSEKEEVVNKEFELYHYHQSSLEAEAKNSNVVATNVTQEV